MVTVENQKDLISEFEKGNHKVMVTGKLKKRAKIVTKTMVFFHIIIVFIAFSRINFENLHIFLARGTCGSVLLSAFFAILISVYVVVLIHHEIHDGDDVSS